MKILITGSSGFIGQRLVSLLQKEGYEIVRVSLRQTQIEDIDLTDINSIIHLSALVHQMKTVDEREFYRINTDQTLSFARFSKTKSVKQFIYFSSIKALGDETSESIPFFENSECNPVDAYGKSKREAEIGLRELSDTDFKVAIVRPPLVYGENVKGNIKSLIKLIAISPVIPLGGINNKRSMVSIDNLTNFVISIVQNNADGIYHITDDITLSTSDFVNYLAKGLNRRIINFKLPMIFVSLIKHFKPQIFKRIWGSLYIKSSQSKELMGYKCLESPETGIIKMLQNYKGR